MSYTELSDREMDKRAAVKALRVNVRLKYALMADAELNKRLPEFTRRIEKTLNAGKPLELTIGEIVDEV